VDLLVDGDVGLAEVLAALGVADDDILYAQVLEHVGGHLAGVGPAGLVVQVLRAHGHPHVLEGLQGGGDVHEGDAHHHLAPLGAGQDGLELLGKLLGVAGSFVHLPVAGNNGLTVSTVHVDLSPV
jgi:hypothetical protein